MNRMKLNGRMINEYCLMKKITLISAAVLSILAAFSCAKEINDVMDEPIPEAIVRTTISASIVDTKTALGAKEGTSWPNYWKTGDEISVNGITSEALDAADDGKTTASFDFTSVIDVPYCAAYPAAAVSGYSAGSATITFPAIQNYVAGSYDPAAFIMIGKSTDATEVALAGQVSLIHLSLSGTAEISRVKITGTAGAALSGAYTTDFSSLTPATVSNEVQIVATTPVALPAEFFFCVPSGLSGAIKVEIYDADGGYMSKNATVKSALAPGQAYSPATLAYVAKAHGPSIAADGITSSTAVINWEDPDHDAYTIGVYSDDGCTTLVNSYSVSAGNACWGSVAPRFCISGLDAGTTYYVRVTNDTKDLDSNILPVTTSAFTIVEVSSTPAAVGDVILAEDFSELRWDSDLIGNGAGFFPTSQDSFANTEVYEFRAVSTSSEKVLGGQTDAIAASRLAHWAQGANNNLYIHPGYIKLVGSNKVTHVVTPALDNIPKGKIATVEVEVTASAYYSASSSSYATLNAVVAVQPSGAFNELASGTNTLDLTTNKQAITLLEANAWNSYKVTLTDVHNGDRLAFGAADGVTSNNARMNLSDMKVTIKALVEDSSIKSIYDNATFLEFVTAVDGGNKALDAVVTVDGTTLSLTPATVSAFNSIEDYEGTFDGNSKIISGLDKPMFATLKGTVKDLTLNSTVNATDESDIEWGMFAKRLTDGASVLGCTAQGAINYIPAAAMSSDLKLGGLVGNNCGGSISTCTNTATVTFGSNGVTNASQSSVGGVVGRTQKGDSVQGSITDCTNSGTVVCDAALSNNLYIGGVLGYAVEKAESMSGCTNSGLVKASSTCSTTAALHIGGVIGMSKGTIESCTNLAGGVVTTEDGCTAGTYICQGGVVGRLNRDKDSYSGLTNAGNINVAAAGATTGAYIGGIAGRCNEGASISDCTNTGGTIEFTGDISTCELHIGGIVGNTNKPVSNCTNATAIIAGGSYSLNSSGKYYSVGGIVGYQKSDEALTDNTNTAAITFSAASSGYTAVGGICGYANGVISGGGNTGAITFSGSSNSQNTPIGGIVARTPSGKSGARIDGVTNSGAIVVNTSTQNGKYIFVGGIVGDHQSGDLIATNSGTITVGQLKCTQLLLGGLVGQNKGEILAGSANLAAGDITISGLNSTQQAYIGGIAGTTNQPLTANNAGDVVLTSGSKASRSFYLGGIIGRCDAALTSCTNSGLISNAAPMSGGGDYWMEIGGIVGYNTGNAPITDCHNTGEVINSGNSGSYLVVGGITGESDALISNCDNTGDITNSGNSGNSHPINIGGIAGRSSAGMTYCSNGTSSANGGTVSNSGTSAERLCIGGLYGYSIEDGSLSHSFNKGDVTNSGDAPAANAIFIGGAIGFQHNNTDSEAASYNKGVASVITYVDNSGKVTNTSTTTCDLQLGGIAAEAWGSVDHCTNSGPVTVKANVAKGLYMGGILGWWETNSSNSVTYCENMETGTVTVDPGLNIENQFWISGVVGGERAEIEATNSHLINRAPVTVGADSNEGAITSGSIKNTTYSYLSGIGGGSGTDYVAYEYCENYGKILYRGTMHRVRVGGVVACAFRSPDHSKCVADIRSYKSRGGNYKDDVGGVIGYYKAETDDTINDILYKGYLNTQSTSPRCYTAGLVGRVNNDAVTFTDCKLGGQIRGVGTSPYNTVAFVCCAVAEHEINVTNLIVETGTKRNGTEVTSLSLNYNNVGGSVGVLCFGTTSETGSTNLDPASSGTMTNCTIGSIDAYL